MIETQYHIISNALPPELCDHLIIENFLYNKGEDARVFNKNTNDYDTDNIIRNTEVVFHPCKSDLGKFFKQNCRTVNKEVDWYFNIDRIESIQILKYQPGSFYNTHIDLRKPKKGKGFHQKQRKISCILLLNNPNEYVGGDLILFPFDSKKPVNLSTTLTKGDLLVFPSFIPHRVEEVISGYRYSATAWIEGLSFR